jgi:hypothetical protein
MVHRRRRSQWTVQTAIVVAPESESNASLEDVCLLSTDEEVVCHKTII